MISSIKRDWCKALRNNSYRQGKGKLRKGDQFCCLGVLCDIIDKTKWKIINNINKLYNYEGADNNEFLTHSLRKRVGLSFFQMNMLMRLNDSGKSFEYIANVIEKQI